MNHFKVNSRKRLVSQEVWWDCRKDLQLQGSTWRHLDCNLPKMRNYLDPGYLNCLTLVRLKSKWKWINKIKSINKLVFESNFGFDDQIILMSLLFFPNRNSFGKSCTMWTLRVPRRRRTGFEALTWSSKPSFLLVLETCWRSNSTLSVYYH